MDPGGTPQPRRPDTHSDYDAEPCTPRFVEALTGELISIARTPEPLARRRTGATQCNNETDEWASGSCSGRSEKPGEAATGAAKGVERRSN